jgi:hypothetical protein
MDRLTELICCSQIFVQQQEVKYENFYTLQIWCIFQTIPYRWTDKGLASLNFHSEVLYGELEHFKKFLQISKSSPQTDRTIRLAIRGTIQEG